MNQLSRRFSGRFAALMVAGVAVCALTACGGPGSRAPERPVDESSPATGGFADSTVPDGMPKAPPPQQPAPPPNATRDVVKTATMTVTVANPSEAADKAAVIVENVKGRVDNRTEDAGSGAGRAQTSVVLRVPVAKLDEVMRELKAVGTVTHVETSSEDVTAQRVDLDARMKALQTSVDRLLAIMRDAKDPDALIKAESALSERQAELDSLRAQRQALGDQIDFSTVNVSFVAERIGGPAPKQYEGFLGQVERGWDGMVWLFRNLVLVFGLLLPWLTALAIVGGIAYGAFRLARARKS
jgi:hypothetical protein